MSRTLRAIFTACCLFASASVFADENWLTKGWDSFTDDVSQTWNDGSSELYVPVKTYHMRWAYSREKIDSFQEQPWGLGYGRGRYDDKGNWHGLYAMEFQDSHYKPEWMAGYGWKAMWGSQKDWNAGLGYTVFITARSDIASYTPFPAVLPLASVGYKKLSLEGTYVPGGHGYGNVIFIWTKWSFGD